MEPVPAGRGSSAQSPRTEAGHPRWSRSGALSFGTGLCFHPVSHGLAPPFPNPLRCAAAVWSRQWHTVTPCPAAPGICCARSLGAAGKAPLCILCPIFPNTQLPRKCLQSSGRVSALSPLSWLIASPTPTPELWGTCCPKHFCSNKSLFPADSAYIFQKNSVFYRT